MILLEFIKDLFREPAFLIGMVAFVGLIALKAPGHKIMTGTLGPIIGYLMLSAGSGVIVDAMNPLSKMIEKGFNISGVIPNNEAVVATAQNILGVETMSILIVGLIMNLLIARITRYKYIFLTGHHSFFMACLLSAVLGAIGFKGILLVATGGFFLGAWSAISPAIGQKYTLKVTDGDDIAMGHFGSVGYYLSAWVGELVGKGSKSTEDIQVSEKFGFLRNTTISTALLMTVFYLISAIAAGSDFVMTLSGGQSPYLFAIISALKFAVGVTIVYSGVRMILQDLLPAFQGIADKIIPNAIPAVDCAVFFPYAQTAVIIGFISSFTAGIVGMAILGFVGGILIVPGLVPHFFCGATAGVYGNATGGRRGAIVGSFINGLALTFLPAWLLPVLGNLGFSNATFGDFDFGTIGILLGRVGGTFGKMGIWAIVAFTVLVLFLPSILKPSKRAINNVEFEGDS